jgi:hypothetical protein
MAEAHNVVKAATTANDASAERIVDRLMSLDLSSLIA